MLIAYLVLWGIAAVILLALIRKTVRIVPEYQRLVVFRLGRCLGERGPGLVILIPIIDSAVTVDLRERFLEITGQTCITADNAPIDADVLIYFRVVDSVDSVVRVADFDGAAQGVATTTLRAAVGGFQLDDVLSKRVELNNLLRAELDEATANWGVKVTKVELREVLPPREVQDAMNRQLAAERNRRAMVTEADGKREAAIKEAQGRKKAAVLEAEGDRESQRLRAEGYALALQTIFDTAKGIDAKTMSLQYLDALKTLGTGPATKFVLPMEFTQLLRPFVHYAASSDEE